MCRNSLWSSAQVLPQSSVQSGVQRHKFKAWSWNLNRSGACAKWACIFMRLQQFVLETWQGKGHGSGVTPRIMSTFAWLNIEQHEWLLGFVASYHKHWSSSGESSHRPITACECEDGQVLLLARSKDWYGCDCASPSWTMSNPDEIKLLYQPQLVLITFLSCFGSWSQSGQILRLRRCPELSLAALWPHPSPLCRESTCETSLDLCYRDACHGEKGAHKSLVISAASSIKTSDCFRTLGFVFFLLLWLWQNIHQ